ncbi:hypothetical protein [Mycolicibacterium fluoranthenivorans]|uniref:Helix-turn-helix domain-containing protein n=1 Tax=Mycolicibacterium fluoranthenivorans TaxID=258505 RepID=A0A7X5U5S2_9MYCO|nr:hypothetical protein [Mycolicibacterium fluoranthenivorans]MCV7354481.1 hypothetical protein [Mycolicibacterium fluoranthenivorans]NIH98916.1 hypothetical protein [Mycolicibacterium fluoranthenivorans]
MSEENRKPAQPPTRWRTRPWPWPEDNREDKAKRVALSYRGLVQRIAQGMCEDPAGDLHRLDEHWASLDIHWTRPRPNLLNDADDEWMSARDIAHALDRTRKDIYNWARAGHIEQRCGPDGAPEYLVGSVKDYVTSLRTRRMNRSR